MCLQPPLRASTSCVSPIPQKACSAPSRVCERQRQGGDGESGQKKLVQPDSAAQETKLGRDIPRQRSGDWSREEVAGWPASTPQPAAWPVGTSPALALSPTYLGVLGKQFLSHLTAPQT